ncbi:hypothetical protein C2845_PM10G07900 [Panicum miliaceum]|uniref:Uncharacterized protein n=1 Tax=Panicum miliaceum TaxID=4540 RepID=A0A3L6PAN3_PANMI|nr:hypothetical protein C2845_PM10G07900 [Panicum miliaceum]
MPLAIFPGSGAVFKDGAARRWWRLKRKRVAVSPRNRLILRPTRTSGGPRARVRDGHPSSPACSPRRGSVLPSGHLTCALRSPAGRDDSSVGIHIV